MLVHQKAIGKLAPADYLVIETEHKLLEKYLDDLRDACECSKTEILANCQGCDYEQQSSCLGRLPSFLLHIVNLARDHFDHEEAIMLNRPQVTEDSEYFRLHQQAHNELMQNLHDLSEECLLLRNEGNAAEIYGQFHQRLSELLAEHDRDFDDPFIASTIIQKNVL